MIDLSFLTEAEQEAILKVLNRDADLKKAEDERVRHLQEVVDDENEFKYKSGQWFYDAKSRRHRDKIHGADLVRASIRKRKKPARIELYGVMEAPDEAEEDAKVKKEEGYHSSKPVVILSPEKEKDTQMNGTLTPPKKRQNPFNSGNTQDYTDYNGETPNLTPQNGQVNGIARTKAEEEPMYAIVSKSRKAPSSSQENDFDLDDAPMEPRFHPQRGKTVTDYQNERRLEFGKSYGGEGKMALESKYPEMQLKENYRSYNKENTATSHRDLENCPSDATQHNDGFGSVISILGDQQHRPPSLDFTGEQKPSHMQDVPKAKYTSPYVQNLLPFTFSHGDYSSETNSKSRSIQNDPDEDGPDGLNNLPVAQNGKRPFKPGPTQDTFLRENKGRRDLPRTAHFKVMSLNERVNVVPSEQMANPSQFQSLKHFWNVEEKNPIVGDADTSPNKLSTDFLSGNQPSKAELQQRYSKKVSAEGLKLPNSFDSLPEEEQTSQKVASWLAQTPLMDEEDQMNDREDQLYSGHEILENVQKLSKAEKYATALQTPREDILEMPRSIEAGRLKNEDAQEKVNLVDNEPTTSTVSIPQTSLEIMPPNADFKISGNTFYDRVLQKSNKQSPVKETMTSKGEPIEENVKRASTPTKSESEFKIGLEKLNDEYDSAPAGEFQKEQIHQPNAAVTEQVIKKFAAPESHAKLDFISALNKLEFEASNSQPLPEAEHLDNLPEGKLQHGSVNSFKIGFENFLPADIANVSESKTQPPVKFQILPSYPPNKEHSIEEVSNLEEIVEKTTSPSQKDEHLHNALRKLELETHARQPVDEDPVHLNRNVELQNPKSQMTLRTDFVEDNSNAKDPSIKEKKSVHELEWPPNASSVFQQIFREIHPDVKKENLPLAEEKPIQRVIVESQSSADFHNRLMRLEEAATIPEEPEDLVEDDLNVSQLPNQELFISKKVCSDIESLPPVDLSSENGKSEEAALNSPKSKSKELNSKSQKLAIYHNFPSEYSGSEDKKPEVGSLEVSNLKQDHLNSSNPQEHLTAPVENSFPANAEKFKHMSQSVPTFLNDETDGRDTDSASESSFQIGRHKKSPSSLTNLSSSSGRASMSSVSGSVMSVYSGDFGNVDVKGAIEFSIEYMEQLKEFVIYIYQCKDLAAADLKKQRSDPYVKAYLLPEKAKMGKRKTAVKKKTLNPVYNEILKYKIPKESLLAQTLNLSVWHHDALGRNSFLGEVNVNLATWNWSNAPKDWHQLEPRTPAAGIGLEIRGDMKLALKYIPVSSKSTGSKTSQTGEVHIWVKECLQLPMLRENKINSFVKCTVLPDTSRKSRQKTRTVDKTPSPIFNHTMVYDGFKTEDLREACVELTVWDHNRLSNHFLGGLRVGLGTGKSYGTLVDWMDSTHEESTMWEKMMTSPNTWIEGLLPLRMFKMAKLSK